MSEEAIEKITESLRAALAAPPEFGSVGVEVVFSGNRQTRIKISHINLLMLERFGDGK